MKKLYMLICGIFLLINTQTVLSQYSLLLLNGKKINTSEYKFLGTDSLIQYLNKKGKTRQIENEVVFSINDSKGEKELVYKPKYTANEYSIDQMRSFTLGANDAGLNYGLGKKNSPIIAATSSYAIGCGSVLAFPAIGLNFFYAPLATIPDIAITAAKEIKESKLDIPKEYKNDSYYIEGYKRIASKKRTRSTLVGAGLGLITGIIIYSIADYGSQIN